MTRVNLKSVALAAIAGYAIGSISPAVAAARLRGVDLRASGSGNPGATNAGRAMGVPIGIAVGAVDVTKGFLPVWYFRRYGPWCGEVAGVSATLGHVTSPLLRGRGGKGVATSLGAILAVEPLWAVPVLGVFGATAGATRQIGIGSVAGSLTLVPTSLVVYRGRAGVWFAVTMAGLVVVRHRRNIREFVASRGRSSGGLGVDGDEDTSPGGAGAGSVVVGSVVVGDASGGEGVDEVAVVPDGAADESSSTDPA